MDTQTNLVIRPGTKQDLPAMLEMVRCLAEYEKRPQDATVRPENALYWLFERKLAEVLLAEYEGETAGYALFFPVYHSFTGQGALHIEDIVFKPAYRGKGFGRQLMRAVACHALKHGYQAVEWACLDWNVNSMAFYEALGAQQGLGIVTYEFDEKRLQAFAAETDC